MRALRMAGLVMLGVAATDGIFDAVEYFAARMTGAAEVSLWPMVLGVAVVLLVVDQMIEHRRAIGKCWRSTVDWVQTKISG